VIYVADEGAVGSEVASVFLTQKKSLDALFPKTLQPRYQYPSFAEDHIAGRAAGPPEVITIHMSDVFRLIVEGCASPDRLQGLDLVNLPHPTDTHPPLSIGCRR
jgi:hypothetical protein